MDTEWGVRPVGYVRCQVTERKQMPVWGAPARIEILPEFQPGLLRIEKHSHLWIFGWLGQNRPERDVLQVTPRGVADPGPDGLHGVFAVRSPARPNPIGLTAARVLSLGPLSIELDRLDFLDGTPVLDIKPYFVTRDLIFSANGAQVGKPRTREALRESLLAQALQFHGRAQADLALAVRLIEHYRATRHDLNDPGLYPITAPIDRPVLIDGLIGITRSTPGRGNFHFGPTGRVTVGDAVYALLSTPDTPLETVLSAPDEALFVVS